MGDLLVRGGTLVDGTGAPPRRADVRVRGGRIVEIGDGLRPDGEVLVDAGGAYVAPGFIESHSHFDGAMWWDPGCDPLPAYGTTTAVIGNCGLTVAPLSSATRPSMVELFCFIEDLPLAAFERAIPWTWEDWPEYRAAIDANPASINVGVFVGHQALRTFVMGPDAWERPATAAERTRIAAVLDHALTVGGLGFSTTFMDTDRNNREVPSRKADDAEFAAVADVLADHPGTTFQFVPRFMQPEHWEADLERIAVICGARGVRGNYPGLRGAAQYREEFAYRRPVTEALRERGVDFWPAFSAAPSYVNLHFERSIMWHGVPSWHEMVNGPAVDKERLLGDPGWRARARAEWDACTYNLAPIRFPERLLLAESERRLPLKAASLGELAAATGAHPSDALASWLLEHGLGSTLRTAPQELDDAANLALLRDPHTVAAISDAGAHIQMFNGAGNATWMLTHFVRDTGQCGVEEIVHAVTGKLAAHFGLLDRGTLEVGQAGDLTVFALDEIDLQPDVRVDDVPGGSWRYTRPPAGYRATAVNGTLTFDRDGATAARPGAFLTAGRRS
ncbi:MAG TPA: amidohydrolase family protein [Acidimicrobiales bacterium]|nr:amidohydrolase family protein [Acidimicrobiales bacterium]